MLYDDNAPKREVIVHRSTIRKDVIELFSDPHISACLLMLLSSMPGAGRKREEAEGFFLMFLQNSGRMCSPHLQSVVERKSPLSGTIYRGHNGRQLPEFLCMATTLCNTFP